jgi:hypothetical protein
MIANQALFERKRVGWGWRPAGWQGWAMTALAVVAVIVAARFIG